MFVDALAEEGDVSVEGDVAGDFLPDEVKGVVGEPHVVSGRGEGERLVGGVVGRGAWMQDSADVGVTFEWAQVCWGVGGEGERRRECKDNCVSL
jgi:hypothetical protein